MALTPHDIDQLSTAVAQKILAARRSKGRQAVFSQDGVVFAENLSRNYLNLINRGAVLVEIGIGGPPLVGQGIPIQPNGGSYREGEFGFVPTGSIYVRGLAGGLLIAQEG